jgi:nucleoside 2-deoxyribosyltransferase
MNRRIYLCGPINGCTDSEAASWRDVAKAWLGEANCIDPMRRDYRGHEDENVTGIIEGDKNDISACDVVLANCWQVSWGTPMELVYARLWCKPVIAVVPKDARVSPWLRYHTSLITDSFDDALNAVLR